MDISTCIMCKSHCEYSRYNDNYIELKDIDRSHAVAADIISLCFIFIKYNVKYKNKDVVESKMQPS